MNKPSQYIPLWNEIKTKKHKVVKTPNPARLKKAICKRKNVDPLCNGSLGKLHFRILKQEEQGTGRDRQIMYFLEIVLGHGYQMKLKKEF